MVRKLLLIIFFGIGFCAEQEDDGMLHCEKIPIPKHKSGMVEGIGETALHFTPAEIFPKAGELYNGPKSVTEEKANTTNRFASIEDMRYYNYFAHAAECPFTARDDSMPMLAQTCRPNPIVLADTDYCETMVDSVTDTFGILFWNKRRKEIIAAFRGTRSAQNILSDLRTTGYDSTIVKGAKVHSGFFNVAKIFYNVTRDRINYLVKKYDCPKIIFVGHSLGGSLATLMIGMTFAYGHMPAGIDSKLITYGQPRIGNEATADFINSWGIEVSRVVANGDVVPHIPTVSSSSSTSHYVHHKNEVWIKGNETIFCTADTYEDSKCSNSLDPTYSNSDHLIYWDVHYGDWIIPADFTDLHTSFVRDFRGSVLQFPGFPSG